MIEKFLRVAIIGVLVFIMLQCYSFFKKVCCFFKYNTKKSSAKILQIDIKYLVGHVISIIFGFYIIYDTYDTYQLALLYNIQDKAPDKIIVFLGIFIIVSAVFSIINEFFPTIVTSRYICWESQHIYQKESVEYYYNNENIFIQFGGKKLFMKRGKKYDILIKILDTNYKRQEEKN